MARRLTADLLRGRGWLLTAGLVAVGSRLFSSAVMAGEAVARGLPWSSPFAAWDGTWYVGIATTGYHAIPIRGGQDYAFFPAWPIVIRVVSLNELLDPNIVATIAANVLFIVAALLIWRIFTRRIDAATATAGLALLAFSPASYVFSMAYSESLFLFVAALAFTVTSPAARGATVAMATLVRLLGIGVAASAAVASLVAGGRTRRAAIAAVAGGIVGFSLWWLFIAFLTGNPMGFLTGESTWLHGVSPMRLLHEAYRDHRFWVIAWFGFAGVVAVGAVLAFHRDLELGMFAVVTVLITTASVTVIPGLLVHSVPRAVVVGFPAFAGLASRLGRRASVLLWAAFAVGQVVFASWTIGPGTIAP